MALDHVSEWTPFMVQFMTAILGGHDSSLQHGRAPCSPEERALGKALHTQWSDWGYSASYEAFVCAPHAFLGVIPVAVLCYFRALNHYWDNPRAAALASGLGMCLFVAEVVRYHEVVDGLGFPFPINNGINVVARMPPRGGKPPVRRLIVSAHQDSAFEFNLFYYLGPVAPAYMALAVVLMCVMPLSTLLAFVAGATAQRLRKRMYTLLLLASALVLPCALWQTGRVVPGAGDDLSGVAVMHAFGGELAAAAKAVGNSPGPHIGQYGYLVPLLDSTEVVLLATSGEEAGLRGAKRYCTQHAADFKALPTAALVLESTHDVEHLSVISAEPWPGAFHDPALVALAVSAGASAGLAAPLKVVSLPLGGTDGTAFTRAGVATAVLNAVDVTVLPPQYHTRLDTLDTVQPEALEAQLKVVLHTAAAFGRGEWRGPGAKQSWLARLTRGNATAAPAASESRRTAFPAPKELSGVESALSSLSTSATYGVAALLVAVGAGAGAALGGAIAPKSSAVRLAGTAVVGAAAAGGAVALTRQRGAVAPKELFNSLVGEADPTLLLPEKMAAVAAKYGVANLSATYSAELCELYDLYLSSCLPVGDTPFAGWEVDAVRGFKDALGLEDQDAAGVHMEVGRRIFRQRMEVDKADEAAVRKEFQKLVFLSNQVFTPAKASFLLPWKRVFNVTDSQIALAVKDSGTKLYKDRLHALLPTLEPQAAALAQLEAARAELNLDAEAAADILSSALRGRVEAAVAKAHEGLRARTRARDVSTSMAELGGIVDLNRSLKALADGTASQGHAMPPGLGPVNLFGGAYDADGKMGELRDLFRMYVAENIKDGQFSDDALARAGDLRLCFALGVKEADAIVSDVSTKVYRIVLKKALADGSLAAAASPARALGAMCDALRFPPQSAEAVHLELYRTRLEEAVAGGQLSESDDTDVATTRRLLCVSPAADRAARKELCGEVWKKVLALALGAGPDGFSTDLRDKVVAAKAAVRLADDVALELLGESVRKVWLSIVRESRNKASRLDAAKELRNLVLYNSAVVTPLVTSIKGKSQAELAALELAEIMKEAQAMTDKEDAEAAATAQYAAAVGSDAPASEAVIDVSASAAPAAAEVGASSSSEAKVAAAVKADAVPTAQKEITLRDELPLSQRQELYRSFLLFCMTGDQVYAPMGSTITIERDASEFARLSQLGDVLGLNPFEVSEVHRGLAEQAFRANAQQLLGGDGLLTRDKTEQLGELQKQLGLPDETAQKVIRGITSGKQTANLQALVATGKLTLEDVEAMAAGGVDVGNALSADLRMGLFRKEVEKALSNGQGVWDGPRWLDTAPTALGLDAAKAAAEVVKVAGDKRRAQLVQAVALLRQRDTAAVLSSLANLRAATQAVGPADAKPMDWPVKEELMDLYSVAAAANSPEDQLAALAATLALDDATCASLRSVVSSGQFKLERAEVEALY